MPLHDDFLNSLELGVPGIIITSGAYFDIFQGIIDIGTHRVAFHAIMLCVSQGNAHVRC